MSCRILEPSTQNILAAAKRLQQGELVVLPTETVYGLGADATNDKAVANIYALKGRPTFNPLIVHVADTASAQHYVTFTPLAEMLAKVFWPGPLTLVLERQKGCKLSLLVSAGLDTVAIRVPAHPVALALIASANLPVAAPSANRSGKISPTQASHVVEEFCENPEELSILDGGACDIGVESTVVDARGELPIILRLGGVTPAMIEDVTGKKPVLPEAASKALHSPGMLESHYAPTLPLRLNATQPHSLEALLAFGPDAPECEHSLNLSPTGNVVEAAANLFAFLRELDKRPVKGIAAMPIPHEGLGLAINDRLARAARR